MFIKGSCRDLQKTDIYDRGTIILAFFQTLSAPSTIEFPNKLDLYLNEDELSAVKSALLGLGSCLLK